MTTLHSSSSPVFHDAAVEGKMNRSARLSRRCSGSRGGLAPSLIVFAVLQAAYPSFSCLAAEAASNIASDPSADGPSPPSEAQPTGKMRAFPPTDHPARPGDVPRPQRDSDREPDGGRSPA